MLSKIMAYLLVVNILLLGVAGVVLKFEHHRLQKVKQENASLQQQYDSLNSRYNLYQTLQTINYDVGLNYQQKENENVSQKKEILTKVDQITKQVESHEITSADADAQYTNSMWDAYCKASAKPSSDCPAK